MTDDSYRTFPHLVGLSENDYRRSQHLGLSFSDLRNFIGKGLSEEEERQTQTCINKKIEALLNNGNHANSPKPVVSSTPPPLPPPPSAPPPPLLELNEINFPWMNQLDENGHKVAVPTWMQYVRKWQLAIEMKNNGYNGQGMTDPVTAMLYINMAAKNYSDWNELHVKAAKFWMALYTNYQKWLVSKMNA